MSFKSSGPTSRGPSRGRPPGKSFGGKSFGGNSSGGRSSGPSDGGRFSGEGRPPRRESGDSFGERHSFRRDGVGASRNRDGDGPRGNRPSGKFAGPKGGGRSFDRRDDSRPSPGRREGFDKRPSEGGFEKRSFERRDDNRGEGRSFERKPFGNRDSGGRGGFDRRDGDNRGEGRSFERKPFGRRDDNRGEGRSFDRKPFGNRDSGGRGGFDRRDGDNRGEGRSFDRKPFERRDDNRGEGRSFERRDDNRSFERKPFGNRDSGGRGGFDRRDGDNRGEGRSFERRTYERKPEPRFHNVTEDAETTVKHMAMKGHELVIYGVHAVQAALRNAKRVITNVWVTDTGEAHLEGAFDAARHPASESITRREIEQRLPEGAVHQGIAVAVEALEDVYLSDILTAATMTAADRQIVVVLDEVTDPHNIGAILRSMSMFGASAMIVHKRNAPKITGVMAKTSTGAIEHIPMVPVTNLAKAIEELKASGFYCLGLDEDASITIDQAPREGHLALILGAEGEGLREKTRSCCDAIASIPSSGVIKSLNVSVAAAISLYSVTRK